MQSWLLDDDHFSSIMSYTHQKLAANGSEPLLPPYPLRKWSGTLAQDEKNLIGKEGTGLSQSALQGAVLRTQIVQTGTPLHTHTHTHTHTWLLCKMLTHFSLRRRLPFLEAVDREGGISTAYIFCHMHFLGDCIQAQKPPNIVFKKTHVLVCNGEAKIRRTGVLMANFRCLSSTKSKTIAKMLVEDFLLCEYVNSKR